MLQQRKEMMSADTASPANILVEAAGELSRSVQSLAFDDPVAYVYNPLDYAWASHESYLCTCAASPSRIVFLGMNPGPYGMAQTGVPFGEIPHVRDWIGIHEPVQKPHPEHPARPVEGFECTRSEVSGRRLVFMEESGRNRTPDKLPAEECEALYQVCDEHLRALVQGLQAEWVVGVGGFAQGRAKIALKDLPVRIGRILHPSPASPAANRGWAEQATRQMVEQRLW
jgi:single-strand selective monofunctional uracil DNA glycosylase